MKLKRFIEELNKISKGSDDDLDVVMADNIPVVSPIFINDLGKSKKVVISDE